MKKFLAEFKEFINRGNVMDLAVGVIIGGAFTSIVTALTTNIINPLISVIAGGGADTISGLVVPGTDIDFGAFISACINFLIVAFVVFVLVKAVNKAQNIGEKLTGKEEHTCYRVRNTVANRQRSNRIFMRKQNRIQIRFFNPQNHLHAPFINPSCNVVL